MLWLPASWLLWDAKAEPAIFSYGAATSGRGSWTSSPLKRAVADREMNRPFKVQRRFTKRAGRKARSTARPTTLSAALNINRMNQSLAFSMARAKAAIPW